MAGVSPYTKIQGVEKILSKKCFSIQWEVSILGTFLGIRAEDSVRDCLAPPA